jgi:hypothetical protein
MKILRGAQAKWWQWKPCYVVLTHLYFKLLSENIVSINAMKYVWTHKLYFE